MTEIGSSLENIINKIYDRMEQITNILESLNERVTYIEDHLFREENL